MERSIKIIPFDGKDGDWREWSAKFLAKANLHGYKDVLLGNIKVPPEKKETLRENEAMAREFNMNAYSNLILSCKGVPFSIVEGTVSKDMPSGDARLAWQRLKDRYQVENMASLVELKREFTQLSLKLNQDPDCWFLELEHIRNRLDAMKNKVNDEDLIAHILLNIPNEYSELITAVEGDLDRISVATLQERIRSYYRRRIMRKEHPSDHTIALINKAQQRKSVGHTHNHRFKGRCNQCGIYGHKVSMCGNEDTETKRTENNVICHFCNKYGHVKKNCYKLKVQESRKNERNVKDEIALIGLTTEVMRDQEIWIGDTGATHSMTNDCHGMKNLIEVQEQVTIGDGSTMTSLARGDLSMILYQGGKET